MNRTIRLWDLNRLFGLAGVASPAIIAEAVPSAVAEVASSAISEVASSADFAGVTSSADFAGFVDCCGTFEMEYGDGVRAPGVCDEITDR